MGSLLGSRGPPSKCSVSSSHISLTGQLPLNTVRIIRRRIPLSEPNLKTVRELIYKRGYGKIDKQRVPLSNNQVIEQALGKYDILSVEDLVHEIFTVGPNFKQVRSDRFYVGAFIEDHCRLPASCGPSSSPTPPVAGGNANSSTTSRVVTLATGKPILTSSSDR